MSSFNPGQYKKYQVYFFLYLAVICELLIIIVERDDAEAELLMQQRMLEDKNRKIILELLKNMPAVAAAGDNQLKVGEERRFTISVKGLGTEDDVTTPPEVTVYRDGAVVETLGYPRDISDSLLHGSTGERLYRFDWKAAHGPGAYELWVNAGTNRVSLVSDDKVKVGTLEFTRKEIHNALSSDPLLRGTPVKYFIERSENLNPDKFIVNVVSEEYDQLQLQADAIVTAVGYATFNEIKVRGTTVDKVGAMSASIGTTISPDHPANPWKNGNGKWAWTGTFAAAGEQTVSIDARDSRQAGTKSVARQITFGVDVRMPVLRKPRPAGAFAGESFDFDLGVDGLEDVGGYAWTATLDGAEIARGSFASVRIDLPAEALGKALAIEATYKGRPFMVADGDELAPASWTYPVVSPIDRIGSLSFAVRGEYPINNVFQFVAARCGRCTPGNITNIEARDIRLSVEDADGRDLLDDVSVLPRIDPNTGREQGSIVRFFLKGKVQRDGTEATVSVRFGSVAESYRIVLLPE